MLKYATVPSNSHIRSLVYDNVCLVAPDVNSHDHVQWVRHIEARGGVYVVINENDYALQWARRKPGEEQKARLGNTLHGLAAENATYVDVTRATAVGDDHSYFQGKAIERNSKLRRMFHKVFTGERPERLASLMSYFADLNAYRLK